MPRLTVHGPEGPPISYVLETAIIRIGRSAANELALGDTALSRVHAEIRRDDAGWMVSDCGSRNGTMLNGEELREARYLQRGDEIKLGRTTLVFEGEAGSVTAGAQERETEHLIGSGARRVRKEAPAELVGSSKAIREIREVIRKVAPTDATVLLTGESGTGKELVASLIHQRSPRSTEPFVTVNCPALPGSLLEAELFGVEKGVATGVSERPGQFETADGGTLFLDEIGDMEPGAQAKILRVLQEKKVERIGGRRLLDLDLRLIAATNHDLEADILEGRFRRDLYHRLSVITIELPPLRERIEDIPALVDHFLRREGPGGMSVDERATEALRRYDYPGNVRELEHIVVRARLLAEGSTIGFEDLPRHVREPDRADRPGAGGDARREAAAELRRRIVEGGESFWEVVRGPFLRRQLPAETVRILIREAWIESQRSYKEMARLFGIESDHKKLLNFLRNHGLGAGGRPAGED